MGKQTEQRKNDRQISDESIAMRVSARSITVNLILSLIKLIAGIVASSGAMLSDAVHSASDVFSTVIVMIGVKLAGRKSDEGHPYGHERLECVASIILAVALAVTGGGIGIQGIKSMAALRHGAEITIPGALALAAAVLSIIVKEGMYWYTRHAAKKINSGALMADAWHHRSDALSSVGSFIGILGARMGFPFMDPAASVIICVFILKAAYDIFMDAVAKMTDSSCDEKTVEQISELAGEQAGVLRVDMIKTRMFGNKKYVDIEISADGKKSLDETHGIAERVHRAVEQNIDGVKHCMVHVNPYHEGR